MKLFNWIKSLFKKKEATVIPFPVNKVEPTPKNSQEEKPKEEPPKTIHYAPNENFEFAFLYTLDNEGGLSNHVNDRGGLTNMGIIKDDLKRMGWPATDEAIKSLTLEQVKEIYKKLYWDALKLDLITSKAKATALYDIGVVRGVGIPPKYAKEITGIKMASNKMEPQLIDAINKLDDKMFVEKFSDRSLSGFKQIVAFNWTQISFLKGWTNRANRLKTLVK